MTVINGIAFNFFDLFSIGAPSLNKSEKFTNMRKDLMSLINLNYSTSKEITKTSTKLLLYLRVVYRKLSESKDLYLEKPHCLMGHIYKSIYNYRAANYMRFSSIEVIKRNVLENKIFENSEVKEMSGDQVKELATSAFINKF